MDVSARDDDMCELTDTFSHQSSNISVLEFNGQIDI